MFSIEDFFDEKIIERAFNKAVLKIRGKGSKINTFKLNNGYAVEFEDEGKVLNSGVFDSSSVISNEPFDYSYDGSSLENDFLSAFTKELDS